MSDVTNALQKSLFEAMSADPGLTGLLDGTKIYDRVPERVDPPYIVLGRSTVSDWSTATEDGEAVVFFIHCWSRSGSRSECQAMQRHVRRVLTGDLPVLPHHALIALRFQLAETRRDRLTGHVHGVMRFRAVIEPND